MSVTQTDSDADLNKAIELSIQQQKTDVGVTTEDIHPFDETVIDSSLDYYRLAFFEISKSIKLRLKKIFFFPQKNQRRFNCRLLFKKFSGPKFTRHRSKFR